VWRRVVPSLSLFWRVFAANAAVLALAFAGLVFAPVTVSVPVGTGELLVLAAGLVALLVTNLVLLRPAFAPLGDLAETMRRHDPLSPGVRAELSGDPDGAALVAGTIPEELRGQLEELRETARQGTEEVRRIASRLRPDTLEELGLQSALTALAGSFERQSRLPVLRHLEHPDRG
jgi:two-component system sensor histidine kinase UhpB